MQDAWRAYLELALGVTEASRKKATAIIRSLAEQSGAKIEDVQGMAEELLTTSMANRENVVKLIRFELDRALGKVGLATNEEVAELTARVRQLEIELRQAQEQAQAAERAAEAAQTGTSTNAAAESEAPAKKAAKKVAAKKTVKKAAKANSTAAKKTTKPNASTAKSATKKTAKKTVKKAAKKSTPPGSGE